ncbi:hypothetical protein I4U23_007053 [Adineta vaga]|nr:hypothetical protein I4U23_007053 [Adineta vaga]
MFDPTLVIRIALMVVSVGTGVGVISAGIAIGVLVSRQDGILRESNVVLLSSANVALNRYIETNELALFYDAVDTMTMLADEVKEVLRQKFGDRFAHVQFETFSPTPNVTSNDPKTTILEKKIDFGVSGDIFPPPVPIVIEHNTTSLNDSCKIVVSTFNCTKQSSDRSHMKHCDNIIFSINPCTKPDMDVLECVNQTVSIYNCSNSTDNIINCNDTTITVPENCDGISNSSASTTMLPTVTPPKISTTTGKLTASTNTTTATATATTTTTTTTVENECKAPANATGHRSIISINMSLYFAVRKSDSILVEDIISALKNLKPSFALYTVCKTSSSRPGSFNDTLSRVEPPKQVDLDLSEIQNQPSISDSLRNTVVAESDAARDKLLPPDSTSPVG